MKCVASNIQTVCKYFIVTVGCQYHDFFLQTMTRTR